MTWTIKEVFLPLIEEEISKAKIELSEELKKEIRDKVITETYFTRKEAASYLKVSITTIDNYCNNGLRKLKIGASTRLRKADIDEFVSNLNSFPKKKID